VYVFPGQQKKAWQYLPHPYREDTYVACAKYAPAWIGSTCASPESMLLTGWHAYYPPTTLSEGLGVVPPQGDQREGRH